jgi:hypothetical protein
MRLLTTLVVATLFSLAGVAQETLSEPEFADVFFRLDAGKLISLERRSGISLYRNTTTLCKALSRSVNQDALSETNIIAHN